MRTTKVVAAALCALLLATLTITAAAPDASADKDGREATYRITVTNNTSGQYLTPPNWAAHAWGEHIFERGHAPSPGVAAVAESGDVPLLAAELTERIDNAGLGVSGVAGPVGDEPGPIGPGASRTFEITTSENEFSIVSMIICTNDGFGGVDARPLPFRDGQTRRYNLADFDAGAEQNTENRVDIVPAPFCSTPAGTPGGTGGDQPELDERRGVIRRHRTLTGLGDLPENFDWDRGSVGLVTVTRLAQPTSYSAFVENLTPGQYFTPLNFAAHSRDADVFSLGEPASAGVGGVAEAGDVPALAAELQAAIDAQGLGISLVVDPEAGPIGPGQHRAFDFATDEKRLSVVSMIVCTNDGFAGLDSFRLPRVPGESRTYFMRAYDAGVEQNTELRNDLVPAPFCSTPAGTPGGTPGDQPEIDENGVITRHRTLRGVGDLPQNFDWRGQVMSITITNNG